MRKREKGQGGGGGGGKRHTERETDRQTDKEDRVCLRETEAETECVCLL